MQRMNGYQSELILSWSAVENALGSILRELKFDCIVGILRGGGLLGIWLSCVSGKPVYFVSATGYEDRERKKSFVFHNVNVPSEKLHGDVLLIDDVYDSGRTMNVAMELMSGISGVNVYPVVLVTKNARGCEKRGIGYGLAVSKRSWVVFPWERLEGRKDETTIHRSDS